MASSIISSPLGAIHLESNAQGLTLLEFSSERPAAEPPSDPFLCQAANELAEYFRGERTRFTVPLAQIGTPFQTRVWDELSRIPYGSTISYGELARRVGQPKASRAVGGANGKNHIAIIVPCHRVIAGDGTLGGYATGPVHKSYLLELEGAPFRKPQNRS
ncbi:methylated-DNA--[protein]-cysteine S-methyltransferase [Proteiniclasticum sp. QWL-01]|uniref:methylated-DNA--[protein]-cysteine S-methyltransferase n=1 Tax=Proteiniclasticum sp. QWL-01 TaxID=3036945 RepID=UPI0021FA9AEA|nr:methylated-DNA--[protein]-cysteine S-methyltransferase [Proteiniclasticum sp. QWL-01]UUM12605.1 methylated-DNA--[protein]-cysteine S-methyltransferase [Clostridiaceae bacterium HFYG-1003]WFF74160.1 methylated-DNA--[protein]-cysteine S-methyltransferase [Proteiniclasticum sp. QWL-01]